MLYAFGEIVLVVIGILIALQINNWNENRKLDENEALLINNIIKDLLSDNDHINQSLGEIDRQLNLVDALIAKAIDPSKAINYENVGLVRYSSDFRPKTQRNHSEAVSNLKNENVHKILQSYFLIEDRVSDIFLEYERILHEEIRPYLRESGMHNLNSLYLRGNAQEIPMMLQPAILDSALKDVKFQQLLYERRLKTASFQKLLNDLEKENDELIRVLTSDNK